ncbi:MAG: hypothetical protein WBM50_04290 [Acidimicrobiales bacterium]
MMLIRSCLELGVELIDFGLEVLPRRLGVFVGGAGVAVDRLIERVDVCLKSATSEASALTSLAASSAWVVTSSVLSDEQAASVSAPTTIPARIPAQTRKMPRLEAPIWSW